MVGQICMDAALLESADEVFETMVFMDLGKSENEDQVIEGETLMGTITFQNGVEGCIAIRCGADCAQTIAQNMLGMDEDDILSEDDVNDAMGEITNMVMGSLKTRVIVEAPYLQISIPTVVRGLNLRPQKIGDGALHVEHMLSVDQTYPIEMTLYYKPGQSSES